MLKIDQGIASHSASKTDIWIGTYSEKEGKESKVIVKLFVDRYQLNHRPYSSGQEYMHELSVYQYLTQELVLNPIYQIRNIIPLVTTVQYSYHELLDQLKTDLSLDTKTIQYNLLQNTLYMLGISAQKKRQKINQRRALPTFSPQDNDIPLSDGKTLNLLQTHYVGMVTPKMQMCSLSNFISKGFIQSDSDFMEYLFILFMTLFAMSKKGINQNDLHWGNVIMDRVFRKKYQVRSYFIVYENNLIFINKRYTPYIYDFDRASVRHKYISFLQHYKKGGNCPTFHSKRDLLKTICCAYHAANSYSRSLASSLLENLVLSPTLRHQIRQTNPSCWLTSVSGTDSLLCDPVQLQQSIPSWSQCLQWVLSHCRFPVFDLRLFLRSATSGTFSIQERHSIQSILTMVYSQLLRFQITSSQYIRHNFQYMNENSLSERDSLLLIWKRFLDDKQKRQRERHFPLYKPIQPSSAEPMQIQIQPSPKKPSSAEPMQIQQFSI